MACQFSNGPIKNFRTLSLWVFLSYFNYSLFIIVILPSQDSPHCKCFNFQNTTFHYGQFIYAGFQAIILCCKFSRTSVYSGFSALPLYLNVYVCWQCSSIFSFLLFYWVSTFFYCSTTANLPFFLPLNFFCRTEKSLHHHYQIPRAGAKCGNFCASIAVATRTQ